MQNASYEAEHFRKGRHIRWLEILAEHSTTHKSGSNAENNTSSICLETGEVYVRYVTQKENMSLEKSYITRYILLRTTYTIEASHSILTI